LTDEDRRRQDSARPAAEPDRARHPSATEPDPAPEPDPASVLEEVPTLEFEITDVLDLHSFPPRDVPALVRDWLDLAYERGFRTLRIIHGRGKGVQRRTVHTLLSRDERVVRFEDAPAGAGGWGATLVEMR
jgi:dsDNA-specific endonuclease/ATPase MutS2